MRRMFSLNVMIPALVIIALLLAACGGDDATDTTISDQQAPADDTTSQTSPPETTPGQDSTPTPSVGPSASEDTSTTTADTTSTTAMGGEESELTTADTELGPVLVGPDGMTLYVFLPDEQGESTCYDSCAATWPPLASDGVTAGSGVDEAMLGTTERTDGTTQATYNGWPLYYYAPDNAPGDVTGQGVGDVWFVIDPSGEVVQSAAGTGQSGAATGPYDY